MDSASCKTAVEIHKHALDTKERTLRDRAGVSNSKVGSAPVAPLPASLLGGWLLLLVQSVNPDMGL